MASWTGKAEERRRDCLSSQRSGSSSPAELFPHLMAGVCLQLQNRKSMSEGLTREAALASSTYNIVDNVFLIVSDKSFKLSIMFQDERKSVEINPYLIRATRIEKNAAEEANGSKLRRQQMWRFSVKYGHRFLLTELIFLTSSKDDLLAIPAEMEALKKFVVTLPYNKKLELFLHHEFESISVDSLTRLSALNSYMKVATGRVMSGKLKNYVSSDENAVTFQDFNSIYRSALNRQKNQSEALTYLFLKNCKGGDKMLGRMGISSFEKFLSTAQGENDMTYADISAAMDKVATRITGQRKSEQPHLSFEDFLDYLYSPDNDVLNPALNGVHQNMNLPLSQYFISSSHNTYLTGNQLASESSVEAYSRSLLQGARCVELDCWDGSDGKPIITHGRTACTKIKLWDVLVGIRDNAFVSSVYPLILSIEDHCSMVQQGVMAKMFKEVFGDLLLCAPVETTNIALLPSPNQLRRKIIIKHKVPKKKVKDLITFANDDDSADDNITEPIFMGEVKIRYSDESPWRSANARLFASALEVHFSDDSINSDCNKITILNLSRTQTEELFKQCPDLPSGTYLIRTKSDNPEDLVLSFSFNESIWHVPIRRIGPSQLALGELEFSGLTELVDHIAVNSIAVKKRNSDTFERAQLTGSLSLKHLYKVQGWYIPHLLETEANRLLCLENKDGSFLLRDDSDGAEKRVLSFLSENAVCHVCMEQTEGGTCKLGGEDSRFTTIMEAVDFFRKHPIANNTALSHPYSNSKNTPCTVDAMTEVDMSNIQSRHLSGSELHLGQNCSKDEFSDQVKVQLNGQKPEEKFRKIDLKGAKLSADTSVPCISVVTPIATLKMTWSENRDFFCQEWSAKLQEAIEATMAEGADTPTKPTSPRKDEAKFNKDLLDLVIYCKSVGFARSDLKKIADFVITDETAEEMSSFSEDKAKKVMIEEGNRSAFQWRHKKQLCRIYPKARRTDSSNFNPVPFWLCGAQMVALNFQTPDKELQINQGWFSQNGGCGYVLKPDFMVEGFFDPNQPVVREDSIQLQVSVLSGRHLHRNDKSYAVSNVSVKLEVIGCAIDCSQGTTGTVQGNAFNPSWDETFDFGTICYPSLAVLRVSVCNQKNELLCQSCLPVSHLRKGYRSVSMKNGFSELDSGLSVLLMFINIQPAKKDETGNLVKKLISDYKQSRKESETVLGESDSEDLSKAMEALSNMMSKKILPGATNATAQVTTGEDASSGSSPRKLHSLKFSISVVDGDESKGSKNQRGK